jgi:hypothetical protein
MIQRVSVPVSVILVFDHTTRSTQPHHLLWEGRPYKVTRVGLHHTYREGRTLHHVWSVATSTLFFRLNLDTETLVWTLEEISDGRPA